MIEGLVFVAAGSVAILVLMAWTQSWTLPLVFLFSMSSAIDFLKERDMRSDPWHDMSPWNPVLWAVAPMYGLFSAVEAADLQWDEDGGVLPDWLDWLGVIVLGLLAVLVLRVTGHAPSLTSVWTWTALTVWAVLTVALHNVRDMI